jgi:nucleotidyltransferase/DNA polymerase involved in DNA repair
MARAILHVDMDQFYAAVEIRDNPALKGKPVVIGADPQGGRGRGVVSTASYEARAFGVHSAMPISKAYKLCPQAVFLQGSMEKYAEESERIFSIFESVTPMVEGLSLDEAFLDVSASRLLFGDAAAVARRIQGEILEGTGLGCSVGVASNKSVAKIASELEKPKGLVLVPEGGEAEFLAPLALKRLWGVGPKAEEELQSLGLRTIGDLAAYPLRALQDRFGEHALHLHELALGRDERPVVPEHEAKSIGRESTFETDSRDNDLLRQTLADLSEDVARRLRRHGFRAAQVTLKIRWSGFETHTQQRQLQSPSRHAPDLFKEACAMMEGFLVKERRPVRLLGLSVSKLLKEGVSVQEGLFTLGSERKERLDQAMDKVAERWGAPAIKRAHQDLGLKSGEGA